MRFFAKRQLVTLFSAPNYCGEFDNAGSIMSVDETLICFLQIFKACRIKEAQYYETYHTTTGHDHKANKEINVT